MHSTPWTWDLAGKHPALSVSAGFEQTTAFALPPDNAAREECKRFQVMDHDSLNNWYAQLQVINPLVFRSYLHSL